MVAKGEIACFKKPSAAEASESVCMREMVNLIVFKDAVNKIIL